MMVGGPQKAVKRLAPILDVLAPETNEQSSAAIGQRGWLRFGPSGAGHYVKMVHNGVEYGLMQAYAEGFDLFDKCEYELDNAKIAHLWGQGSVVRSWLCELAARAFEADGNDLATIEGFTEDSGEGRWTIEDATAHDVPTPVITASLYARFRSRGNGDFADRVLAALRNQFGGHAVKSAPARALGRAPREHGRASPRARGARAGTLSMAVAAGRATEEPAPENPLDGRASSACRSRRRRSSSSAPPATSPGANCCRRSTTSPTRARCPSASTSSGVSRKEKAHEDYRAECEEAIRRFSRRTPDETVLAEPARERPATCPGTFDEDSVYSELAEVLDDFERQAGEPLNRAFYLSTAPSFFPVIVEQLGRSELATHEHGEVRVIIEKPFGTTLQEARELNRTRARRSSRRRRSSASITTSARRRSRT